MVGYAVLIYKYEIPDPTRPTRLIPFKPPPLDPSQVIGREITGWTAYAGTYGMGGPGFVGFALDGAWLIVAVWGAGEWIRLEGRLLQDIFADKRDRPRGWDAEPTAIREGLLSGRHFANFHVERASLSATLDDGRQLWISEDPSDRPIFEGSGQPREIGPDDDLRRAVFLAPTADIWV